MAYYDPRFGVPNAPRPDEIGRGPHVGDSVLVSQVSKVWVFGAAGAVIVGVLTTNTPLFALGALLGASLLLTWVWARYALRSLQIERRLGQTRAFFGEEVEMAHVITNGKPLPLPWLSIEDELPSTLEVDAPTVRQGAKGSKRLVLNLSLRWYERVTLRHTVKCTMRGEHVLGPMSTQTGDIFGIFRRHETIETPEKLLVYPRYVPIERLGLPARQPFGESKAILDLATDPMRVRAVREYAYGDSPRSIHWRATARRGTLQTKLYEPAATPQMTIFCNQDTFTKVWEGIDRETLELTLTVAASLANHALLEGYMVGLQVNSFTSGSDSPVRLMPSRSPDQLTRILENLARVRGWSGQPVEEMLEVERKRIPLGATVVVATSVVTDHLVDVLAAIRRAGHPVTLVETAVTGRWGQRKDRVPTGGLQRLGITYHAVEADEYAHRVERLAL